MKYILFSCVSLCIILFLSSCACVPLRKYHDKRLTRYINRNLPTIHTLGDSLRVLGNNSNYNCPNDTLKSRQMKKTMSALGYGASVYYNKPPYASGNCNKVPCDSMIIFNQISLLLGVREIIYDFSTHPKSYPQDLRYRNFYSFRKVAPNIYIKRSHIHIPMM